MGMSFMGLYDRDYTQYDYDGGYRPQVRMLFPSMMPVVKWLLIINAGVFVLTVVSPRLAGFELMRYPSRRSVIPARD